MFLLSLFQGLWAQEMFISHVDHNHAAAGTLVKISGKGFPTDLDHLAVFFGTAKAEVQETSEWLILACVPAGATYGYIRVFDTDRNLMASSTTPFFISHGGNTFVGSSADVPVGFSESAVVSQNYPMYDLCSCDFDGDGKMDVALTHFEPESATAGQNIDIFLNRVTEANAGAPLSAASYENLTLLIGQPTINIDCGDLDNDGLPDLIATQAQSGGGTPGIYAYIFKNTTTPGSVSFSRQADHDLDLPENEAGDFRNIRRVFLADLDKDGKLDIVVNNEKDRVLFIYKNNTPAGGALSFPRDNPISLQVGEAPVDAETSEGLLGLSITDLNWDGYPEIVVGESLGSFYILKNKSIRGGAISFGASVEMDLPQSSSHNLVTGDLDGDTRDDIAIVGRVEDALFVFLNTTPERGADIQYDTPLRYSISKGPWGLALGDIDGNGFLDIVVSSTTAGGPFVFLNRKRAASDDLAFDRVDLGTDIKTRNVKVADANADGKPDLLLASDIRGGTSQFFHVITNSECTTPTVFVPEYFDLTQDSVCDASFFVSTLSGSGLSYNWEYRPDGVPGAHTSFSTDQQADLSLLPAGRYEVRVTISYPSDRCALSSDPIVVQRTSAAEGAPTLSTAHEVVCVGSTFAVQSTIPSGVTLAADPYCWLGPAGFVSTAKDLSLAAVSAEDSGYYRFLYKSSSGCVSDTASVKLEVRNVPRPEISVDGLPLSCQGTGFSKTMEGVAFTGATFQWLRDGAPLSGATQAQYTATQAGDYALRVHDGLCEVDGDAVTLEAVAPPVSAFSPDPELACPGAPVPMRARSRSDDLSAGELALSYVWDFADGTESVSAENTAHAFSETGTFSVTLTTCYEEIPYCSDEHSETIEVVDLPTLSIARRPDKEKKCPLEDMELTAPDSFVVSIRNRTATAAVRVSDYRWNVGAQSRSISVREEGTYAVTLVGNISCNVAVETEVLNIENSGVSISLVEPAGDFLSSEDSEDSSAITLKPIREGTTLVFSIQNVLNDDPEEIGVWSRSVGLDASDPFSPTLTLRYDPTTPSPYLYTSNTKDNGGCASTLRISVPVLPDPLPVGYSLFTPNGDGTDDFWSLHKLDLNAGQCTLRIFDRRGKLVLHEDKVPGDWQGWDGTFRGQPVEEDVYFYTIACDCASDDCPRRNSGNFLLLR